MAKIRMAKSYVTVLVGILITMNVQAQTCCSGGVPLTNSIGGLPISDTGSLQLALNFDANILNTLKENTNTLNDNSRRRITYSTLLKSSYTLNSKLSVEGLFTWVRQERLIRQTAFGSFTSTNGIGDFVLLANFKYHQSGRFQFVAGAGPKLPVGSSDLKDKNDITLSADLQPGSGALDGVFTHRIIFTSAQKPTFSASNMITYRKTGKNKNYLGSQVYQFGDELQVIAGITDQFIFGHGLFNVGANLRFRNVGRDTNDGVDLPNSGGTWLFLMPVVAWHITPQRSLTFSTEFPLYSQVDGTQLSPTIRINIGIYFSFQKKKRQDLIFNP